MEQQPLMKAMVATALGDAGVLRLETRPRPEPGADEVLIRVVATSVNFADIKAREGRYHGGAEPPFIPGLDAAGVVESVGRDVTRIAPGMRVVAFPHGGSYAEYVVARDILVFPIPETVAWAVAAALPIVSFTAYKLLADVARLNPGERVLVHAAAGGVGTTAIQLARIMGASQTIGTVSRDSKSAAARDAGADAVVNYAEPDWLEKVKALTQGDGVDVILDSIGGTVSEQSVTVLARFGRLVHFGSASGQPGHIRVSDLHASCRSVLGFSLGTVRVHRPELVRPAAEAVLQSVKEGRLTMAVGRRYPLAAAAEAHRWMESRQSTGKIILMVDEHAG